MITLEDLQASSLTHVAHLDGPRGRDGWFGDMHQCRQYPRLQRRVRYFRKDRSHDVTWYVDGQPIDGGLEATLPFLNQPPVMTPEEQAIYDRLSYEFVDRRRDLDVTTLLMLRNKGLVEFKDGKCRRIVRDAKS